MWVDGLFNLQWYCTQINGINSHYNNTNIGIKCDPFQSQTYTIEFEEYLGYIFLLVCYLLKIFIVFYSLKTFVLCFFFLKE